jgi:hypothetical protein
MHSEEVIQRRRLEYGPVSSQGSKDFLPTKVHAATILRRLGFRTPAETRLRQQHGDRKSD